MMRRSRYLPPLFAIAALAAPVLAGPDGGLEPVSGWALVDEEAADDREPGAAYVGVAGPPALALLAAGLALGLARGGSGVRRPVRRRRD